MPMRKLEMKNDDGSWWWIGNTTHISLNWSEIQINK
jgi:hypothetical protein